MRPPRKTRRDDGFTIIELMIGVAIAGILAAVALPAYNSYIQRSKVPVGLDALSAYATRMEQRYQDTGSYRTGSTGGCNEKTAFAVIYLVFTHNVFLEVEAENKTG